MPDRGPSETRLTLDKLNSLGQKDFAASLGDIYEHSPWVAQGALTERPFKSVTDLHAAMQATVDRALDDARVGLLRAHPDLAGKAALAGELTEKSSFEQSSAGLDSLTPEEMERFQVLNAAYRDKFGFPFIIAVRNATKALILAAFESRTENDPTTEMATALREVGKIAWMRLLEKVIPAPTGRLTTHVLDTAAGKPAGGLPVDLFAVNAQGPQTLLATFVTNADGRLDAPALEGERLKAGTYELLFHAGIYFARAGLATDAPAFLDSIPIRFAISNPESHYHVPLLLSPWSYSTYRGS